MTGPYSMDLRERAVARVLAGESMRSVAAALSISAASVVRWSQRHRRTGSAAPGKIGGHRRPTLGGAHRDWLLERVLSDFTLRGLVTELTERGVQVDYVQVWREGLSFKKKRPSRRAAAAEDRAAAGAMEEVSGPA
jgi:putative transposase